MKQLTSYNRVAGYLNKIFDLLNEKFFENALSRPTITIQSTPKAYGRNSTDKSESDGISFNNYTSNWSSYYNDDYGSSGGAFSDDSSTIFKNLDITNFSASPGFHGGQMSCKVTNNNPVMITGYISVNFYDYSEGLLYTQLISVPDVASGEAVVCSTLIPKDAFNVQYDYVEFSQGNLAVVD